MLICLAVKVGACLVVRQLCIYVPFEVNAEAVSEGKTMVGYLLQFKVNLVVGMTVEREYDVLHEVEDILCR